MSSQPSDADFLPAILHGDRRVLTEMYRQLFPMTQSVVSQLGGSDDDARDIFQDAVMVVFDKARLPDFVLESKFSTFFYGICRNLWLNRWQKINRRRVTNLDEAKPIADAAADFDWLRHERLRLIDHAFDRLGEDCRRLMQLHLQKKSVEAITAEMKFSSEGYTRRRKHQCKERLIEFARQQPGFDELIEH